jgi:hypothetical protein
MIPTIGLTTKDGMSTKQLLSLLENNYRGVTLPKLFQCDNSASILPQTIYQR